MKKIIYSALIIIISGLSACTSYDYYVAGLNRTNLSRYRTFAWMPVGRNSKTTVNPVADTKIKDAATSTLVAKGLSLQQRDPDLLIAYSSVVGRGSRTVYSYYGGYPGFGFGMGWGGWGWGGFYRPYYYYGAPFAYGGVTAVDQEHYKEGTLIIDLVDRRTHEIVWRGFGVGEVHHNHEKDIEDIPKVVDGILTQLSLEPSSAAPAGGSGVHPPRARRGGIYTPTSNQSI